MQQKRQKVDQIFRLELSFQWKLKRNTLAWRLGPWPGNMSQNGPKTTSLQCAVPTDHLCSEMSFSCTSNSLDLISYIYRIASGNAENFTAFAFIWLRNCMHTKTNIYLVYIFLSERCPDGSWTIFGGGASRFFMHAAVLHMVWSSFRRELLVVVDCYHWSRTRGKKRLKTTSQCKSVA